MSTPAPPPVAPPPARPAPAFDRATRADDRELVDPEPDPSARTGVRMTADEFLRLPVDPALDRWLLDGDLWEEPMTVRSVPHSVCENRIGTKLRVWLDAHPEIGGEVASGESGVRMPGRETAVGVDVVLFDAKAVAAQPPPPKIGEGVHVWHGVPRLVVEIVSASDREENVASKMKEYLAAGVPQVWIARPTFETVTVHRSDAPAATFQGEGVLEGGPELPGFAARAADLLGK